MDREPKTDDRDLLGGSLIFEKLDEATVAGLLGDSRLERFPPGAVLFHQGDTPDFLYVVLSGALELFATDFDGNDTIIEIIESPHTYTLAPVLTGAPYLVSGRIVRAGQVLMLDADTVTTWVARDLQLSHNMLGLLSRQFRMMVHQVKTLKLRTAAERLGCYLVSLHEEQGVPSEIALPYDKRRIAARLGMTPVSLSRAFARLGDVEVTVRGRGVRIGNIERLRDFCKPDHLMSGGEENLRFVGAPGPKSGTSQRTDRS